MREAGGLPAGASVDDFVSTSIGDGVGLLGHVVRVALTYTGDGSGPATVVIKFAHPVEANRQIAMNTRMYEREVTFFKRIANHVDVPMPACYAAEVDVETGRAIVVLEDMKGYRVGDQVEGCYVEEAKQIIDAFVPLHVAFWGDTDRDILDTAMRIDTEYIDGFSPAPAAAWQRCVEVYGHCLTPYVRDGLEEYIANVRDLHTLMGDRTQTLVHGDVRLDNVMFGEEEGQHEIALIDWQAIMVSNPGQDLAYLLSQNVRTEERRGHEDELLHHYHDRLLEQGVRGLQLRAVRRRLRRGRPVPAGLPDRGGRVRPPQRAGREARRGLLDPRGRDGHRPPAVQPPAGLVLLTSSHPLAFGPELIYSY